MKISMETFGYVNRNNYLCIVIEKDADRAQR